MFKSCFNLFFFPFACKRGGGLCMMAFFSSRQSIFLQALFPLMTDCAVEIVLINCIKIL